MIDKSAENIPALPPREEIEIGLRNLGMANSRFQRVTWWLINHLLG